MYGEAEAYALAFGKRVASAAVWLVGYWYEPLACGIGYRFGDPAGVACAGKIEYHTAKVM